MPYSNPGKVHLPAVFELEIMVTDVEHNLIALLTWMGCLGMHVLNTCLTSIDTSMYVCMTSTVQQNLLFAIWKESLHFTLPPMHDQTAHSARKADENERRQMLNIFNDLSVFLLMVYIYTAHRGILTHTPTFASPVLLLIISWIWLHIFLHPSHQIQAIKCLRNNDLNAIHCTQRVYIHIYIWIIIFIDKYSFGNF